MLTLFWFGMPEACAKISCNSLCCLLLNSHWFAQGAPGRKKRRARKKKSGFATYFFSFCFGRGNSTVYSCISISTLLYTTTLLLYDSNSHSRSECHFWLTNLNSFQRGCTASEAASRNSRRTAPIGRVSKATALKILQPIFPRLSDNSLINSIGE